MIPEPSIDCLTSQRQSLSATGGRRDWFSARHQDTVGPLAWQPVDLRSPSIVCLIDYFPSNYSRVTLNISPLREGGKRDFISEGRHSYCHICEPLMWIMKRHMLNWMGHQWWLVLIDCSVLPFCDRERETIRVNGFGFHAEGPVALNFLK